MPSFAAKAPGQLLDGGDEGRDLKPGVAAVVDDGRPQVVGPVQPRVDGEQEADENLIRKHDGGFEDVEGVAREGSGGDRLVVQRVDGLVQQARVQGAVRPVEPRVVEEV